MDHQLVQEIYSASIQPERFEELLTSWEEMILSSADFAATLGHPDVLSHVRQAVAMFQHFDPTSEAEPVSKDEDGPYPIIVCDAGGGILMANPPAQSRYGVEHVDGLPFDVVSTQAILAAISRVARETDPAPVVISAQKSTAEAPSVVSIHRYRGTTVRGAGLVQIVTNDFIWPDGLNEILERTFQLSSAECAVMQLMAEGAGVSEVAQMRGSSVATVRVQVRSIYDKTEVRNQAEMLRLAIGFVNVFNLAGTIAGTRAASHDRLCPDPSERQLLSLDDGRTLSFTDLGEPRGLPVVVLHDEYYGDFWSAGALQQAVDIGLRIITPARPYFGQSDGYPTGVDAAEQSGRDVEALLGHLDVAEFVVLARRTGFRYAVHLAHLLPQRLVGIVTLSPSLPAQSTDEYRNMTGFARFISHAIFNNPTLVELASQAGIRYYNHMGARKFAQLLNKGSTVDLAILDDPEQWALIEAGMRFASSSGHLAYLHDVLHDPREAWQKTVDCPVPIQCLIGSLDPHDRLRRAQRCIDAGVDMSVMTLDGAGQLFFYSHVDEILNAVDSLWASFVAAPAENVRRGSQP